VLSAEDLQQLESTLLPALERHHLRLLAHSLRCLQQASATDPSSLEQWAHQQPNLAVDPTFIPVLVGQLAKAAQQLDQIGKARGKAALALEIPDLVAWGQAQADARLKPPHN
jgi:hypothetical protein